MIGGLLEHIAYLNEKYATTLREYAERKGTNWKLKGSAGQKYTAIRRKSHRKILYVQYTKTYRRRAFKAS
uniref:Uncharacterized protein n=1 Tax=Photorhabdus asymbiotica TaxID=291112 RepID=D8MBZ6_9GAMM|nr:hypothetical protein pPAA3_0007 [Photorhabdus asymbiotica]